MTRTVKGVLIPHSLRWKGKLDGKEGSFPANFVEIV